MSLNSREPKQTRRRGAELENALLDAAWTELVRVGYDELTFDAVAKAASTSRAVLWRRWPVKPDLVRDALRHMLQNEPLSVPDTGSLREDVIAALTDLNRRRIRLGTVLVSRLGSYYEETNSTFSDLRDLVLGSGTSRVDIIMRNAAERGEISREVVGTRVSRVPFDLFRYEALMTQKPVAHETITEIVDEVFLPMVSGAGAS